MMVVTFSIMMSITIRSVILVLKVPGAEVRLNGF